MKSTDEGIAEVNYPVLDTASLHLVVDELRTVLLCLGLVDVFHQDALVFEDITLGLLVEYVVTDRLRENA